MQFLMKDIRRPEQRVLPALRYFFLIFLLGAISSFAQNGEKISAEEYEVINSVFSENPNNTTYIYEKVYYDKAWANYFDPDNFESITSNVGIPTTITDNELRDILNDKILFSINSRINSLKPIKINRGKLNKYVRLSRSFDEPGDLIKGVQRISQPIIIGDIAVFRKIGFLEAPIYILKKENKSWKIIYTFYDWLILE